MRQLVIKFREGYTVFRTEFFTPAVEAIVGAVLAITQLLSILLNFDNVGVSTTIFVSIGMFMAFHGTREAEKKRGKREGNL